MRIYRYAPMMLRGSERNISALAWESGWHGIFCGKGAVRPAGSAAGMDRSDVAYAMERG